MSTRTLTFARARRRLLAVLVVAAVAGSSLAVGQSATAAPTVGAAPVAADVPRTVAATASAAIAVASPTVAVPEAKKKKKTDVRLTRKFFVDNRMPAAQAAKKDKRFAILGKTAQALWATDYYSPKEVKVAFKDYVKRAAKAKQTPVIAVYAIPNRDCGGHSAGGFSASKYKKWVKQLANGIKGSKSIVVLEPDALAFMGECSGQGNRAGLLKYAAKTLKAAGAWVYIDAGHNGWNPASTVALRLIKSGVQYARGFTLNVGNYQYASKEIAYGKKIVSGLSKRGYKGKKYMIETARNGAGPSSDGNDVCNPPHARIGAKPRMVRKGSLDAYVWIKHPGESDGECYGGPPSGEWWPEGALKITGQG